MPGESRRFYRQLLQEKDLVSFGVKIKETDLRVAVDKKSYSGQLAALVEKSVWQERLLLEEYIGANPGFQESLTPYVALNAPGVAMTMVQAGNLAGVGPMAAVAGTFSEIAGKAILPFVKEVIVENGGDIFLKISRPRLVGIYAGRSPLSGKIAIRIPPEKTPLGVCTSSGTVGPSYSLGRADAVVVLSPSTPLADAVATVLANEIRVESDLETVMAKSRTIKGIEGVLAICEGKMAAWGEIHICPPG